MLYEEVFDIEQQRILCHHKERLLVARHDVIGIVDQLLDDIRRLHFPAGAHCGWEFVAGAGSAETGLDERYQAPALELLEMVQWGISEKRPVAVLFALGKLVESFLGLQVGSENVLAVDTFLLGHLALSYPGLLGLSAQRSSKVFICEDEKSLALGLAGHVSGQWDLGTVDINVQRIFQLIKHLFGDISVLQHCLHQFR